MEIKKCTKCGIEKELSEFSTKKSHNGKIYHNNKCKSCWKEHLLLYRESRRDIIKENQKKNYYKNHEIRLEDQKRYREANKDLINERQRESYATDENRRATVKRCRENYYNNNKEHALMKMKEYYENNKEQILEYVKKWQFENKDKVYKSNKKWQENNKERRYAHIKFNNYLKKFPDIKPDNCSLCGNTEIKLEAHHNNYSKPLEVVWMCRSCHIGVHKVINGKVVKEA